MAIGRDLAGGGFEISCTRTTAVHSHPCFLGPGFGVMLFCNWGWAQQEALGGQEGIENTIFSVYDMNSTKSDEKTGLEYFNAPGAFDPRWYGKEAEPKYYLFSPSSLLLRKMRCDVLAWYHSSQHPPAQRHHLLFIKPHNPPPRTHPLSITTPPPSTPLIPLLPHPQLHQPPRPQHIPIPQQRRHVHIQRTIHLGTPQQHPHRPHTL